MFEIGKQYDVTMLEWGDTAPGPVKYPNLVVEEFEGTLLKRMRPAAKIEPLVAGYDLGGEIPEFRMVVNTASLYFVSAEPAK